MKWITRHRPKIDRIACPWLILRFIDPEAEIIYVPDAEVKPQAEALGAIPFDVPGVEFTHYKDECTFDFFLKKYELNDPALHVLAPIVRAADTDRHHLAEQAAGLWAITAGLSHNFAKDEEVLEKGRVLYDALYSWAKYHRHEKHTQNPAEKMLLDVFHKFLENKKRAKKKIPDWAKKLKELIQDQIDTSLTLKEISKDLDLNPAYISREFSKYFEDLSFGEYIRKQRIEKALQLLGDAKYSLTEIAYLTGFSDQSHFTRIFKQHTGKTPSAYRKHLFKSKSGTKS